MATPSVLTVPSMYGDGILYSGPTVFGPELITNGTFNTDLTGWSNIVNVTWSANFGGSAFMDSSIAESQFRQNLSFQVGKTYEISWEVKENNGCDFFRIYINNSYTNITNPYVGGHSLRFTHTVGSIFILRNGKIGSDITIDNVSVKEITQGSDFEFTRSTTGTRINEDGYIEDVPYNLATYSEDFSQWTKQGAGTGSVPVLTSGYISPDGTNNAYKVSFNKGTGTTTSDLSILSSNAWSAQSNTASFYIKADSPQKIVFRNSTNWVLVNVTTEWQRVSKTDTGNSLQLGLRDGYGIPNVPNTATVFLWGAQAVKGDQPKDYLPTTDRLNLPRLNYPVYGGCPSLLVEPQRTNILPYSEDFSNSNWINQSTDTTLSVVSSGSPDGGAFYRCTSGSNGGGRIVDVFSASLTGGVFSIYAKGSGSLRIDLFINGGGNVIKTITLTSEWKRYDVYNPHTNSSGDVSIRFFANSVADIFGAQLESGSYATSYIPTSGSTVTRNEDKALYAGLGTTDTFNDSEGVLFIETEALVNEVNARGISINAGNGLNRVLISYPSSGDSSITGYLQSTAGSGAGMTITGIDTTQKHKVAIKYKLNDTSLFIDGVKRAVDTSVVMPVGLKQLDFSNGISVNTAEYEGNLNAIAVYKTALTDTELANLTSYNNHDLFIPYRSRMQMISADQELQCTEHDITRFL